MICYNVQRRFFAMKADAEAHRKALGLRSDHVIPVRIESREELAAILTGLCEPKLADVPDVKAVLPGAVVDRAHVESDFDVPLFLRRARARLFGETEPAT